MFVNVCGQQWWEWSLGQHWSWHQVTSKGHIFRFCSTCPILYYATGRMISGNDPPVALHKLTSSVWYMFLLNWGQNPPLQWQQFQTNHKLITNKHFLLLGVKTNLRGHKTALDFHVTCICCDMCCALYASLWWVWKLVKGKAPNSLVSKLWDRSAHFMGQKSCLQK